MTTISAVMVTQDMVTQRFERKYKLMLKSEVAQKIADDAAHLIADSYDEVIDLAISNYLEDIKQEGNTHD
jgi:hypothetical protein